MASEVIVRLGSHAEKEYLVNTLRLFSGALVGANLLEATPGATVSLAWKIATSGKLFLIDPMTYLYALDLDYISSETKDRNTQQYVKDIKRSFRNMCSELGEPFTSIILTEGRSLKPSDFDTDQKLRTMSECVMSYQLNRMQKICATDVQLQSFADIARPSTVFCPYFYIPADGPLSAAWEDVNMNLIQTFGSMECPVPKAAVLCVARKMLKDRDRLSRLLRRVLASGCESCWLWISALREEDVNEAELTNLVLLSKQAQGSNFPLWNMHGGFFSALLNKHGMNGFSHGIGYGESKDVLPVGVGALPTVAFHYNPLHVRCSVLDIERGFSSLGINDADAFHETVCDCVMCKGTLKGDLRNFRKYGELILKKGNSRQSQSAESAKRCRFHFLLARRKELDYVNARTIDELRSDLSAIVDEYTNLSSSIPLRSKSSALRQWVSAF